MKAPILLALAGLSISIANVGDATLTLACKGIATDPTQSDAKPESVSFGIIINLTAEGGLSLGRTLPFRSR
jgi:hypothetical protein